jgi:hypothetical protein
MAHFAKMNGNLVEQVIVVSNDDAPTEAEGQAFIASLGLNGVWLQTSYSASFRGAFAGIGYTYSAELDEFVAPPAPELPVEE